MDRDTLSRHIKHQHYQQHLFRREHCIYTIINYIYVTLEHHPPTHTHTNIYLSATNQRITSFLMSPPTCSTNFVWCDCSTSLRNSVVKLNSNFCAFAVYIVKGNVARRNRLSQSCADTQLCVGRRNYTHINICCKNTRAIYDYRWTFRGIGRAHETQFVIGFLWREWVS